MTRYVIGRLALAAGVMLVVSMLSFSMIYMAGDPAITIAGESATDADINAVRKFYRFDDPIYAQYGAWMANALRGDFGRGY